MKQTTAALALSLLLSGTALASGQTGNLNNDTGYVIECSQVIGGYCANNPMPANGYIQMLPDPGSKDISGHVMVYDSKVPGQYVDNILFDYSEHKDGTWGFTLTSLYKKTAFTAITPSSIILTQAK